MKRLFTLLCIILLTCACAKREEGAAITIYHTNDIQGFYWARNFADNDNKETGGVPALKEMLDKQPQGFLLFDSGDSFSKTQEGQIGKLEGAINLMNKTGYTAATLSAADFTLGWDNMEPALAKANFPVIISNLKNADGTQPKHIQKYFIMRHGDVKIALLGVLSKKAFPKIQRNAHLKVSDELETLKALIPRVQEEGADIIILLSSLGFELDEDQKPDETTIAEEIPEINIILGGNADISTDGYERVSNTYISRADPMLTEVEKITLRINDNRRITSYANEQIRLDKATFGEDEHLAEAVAQLRAAVKKITGRRVATLPSALESHQGKQSPLGVYTADCIRRWAYNDIGIINSDLFLVDFPKGVITEVDLLNSIPFNDRVMLVKMRGDELKNTLEHTLEFANSWPQTAGINVVYNPEEPFGKRIKKITVNNNPLRDNALYTISTSDHIVAGGFGHNEFLNVFEFKNTDRTVRDIARWCLARQKDFTPPQTNQWQTGK